MATICIKWLPKWNVPHAAVGWFVCVVSKNGFNYDNSAIILVKIIWHTPSSRHAHTHTHAERASDCLRLFCILCARHISGGCVQLLFCFCFCLCFCLSICILSSSWLFFIFIWREALCCPPTQTHPHTKRETQTHTNWICMKLMSSSLRPCTEFNLHSPKSHAVIWHVYQTEGNPILLCTHPSLWPFVLVIRRFPSFALTLSLYRSLTVSLFISVSVSVPAQMTHI